MSEPARVGREATLEQVERELMAAWQAASAQPDLARMIRCVDLFRLYQRMMADAYPPPPELRRYFRAYPPALRQMAEKARRP